MGCDYELLERFFGGKFKSLEAQIPFMEMMIEAPGIRYRLLVIEEHTFVFNGDPVDPSVSCPAIEIGTEFDGIRQTEALGIGPVLLVGLKNKIRLWILRMPDGRISVSPNWNEEVNFNTSSPGATNQL